VPGSGQEATVREPVNVRFRISTPESRQSGNGQIRSFHVQARHSRSWDHSFSFADQAYWPVPTACRGEASK